MNFSRTELLREMLVETDDDDKDFYITEAGWNDHPRWTKGVQPSYGRYITNRADEMVDEEWDWC